jgi:putative oxidoreductase
MSLPRRAARAMLAASFISGGLDQIRNPQPKREPSRPVIAPIAERIPQLPKDPEQLVKIDGAIKVAGGLGLIFGPFARPSALVLAGSLVPTTLAGHRFWEADEPQTRKQQKIHFLKNVSMLGGLLIAAADTSGRPSLAWRSRHAAQDVRRQAQVASNAARTGARAGSRAGRARGRLSH